MKTQQIATDALGKPIEIGKVYGYSQSNAGIISVTVGIVESVSFDGNSGFAKMRVLERRRGYNNTAPSKIAKKHSRIKTCSLFKLTDYEQ